MGIDGFRCALPILRAEQDVSDDVGEKTPALESSAFIIGEYPPVLITLEEEFAMADRGFKVEGTPEQRYAKIPITGFTLHAGP